MRRAAVHTIDAVIAAAIPRSISLSLVLYLCNDLAQRERKVEGRGKHLADSQSA